ncbi:MAG: hypothetical protein KY428_06100 [Bacteroidetes bacterium]|nr:hypothetical protein [Bacteroidota bacterium]
MLLLPAFGLQAQKVLEGRWQLPAGKSLQLKLDHAEDIQLKGWDKPEVQIKAVVEINGGRYNDALSLKATEVGESLSVSSVLDKSQIGETSTADCNDDQANWQVEGGKNKLILCMNIRYEVWVPRQAAIKLETISGNVTGAGLQGALDLHSISGFIDISLPEAVAADLWLKSVTGELYTDLDMKIMNEKEEFPIVGYEMRGQLKGGGTEVKLETISSNIYLRKK